MNKILIMPPQPWYMEAHAEYLIRYLSDEFIIEIADVPYPPFKNFIGRFPETNPFQRNPDDYDLLWPILPTHWVVPQEEYAHKVVSVFYQPGEGRIKGIAALAASTPIVEESIKNIPHYSLRFGIDTNLFFPLKFKRPDNLLRVGMVGNLFNPRRMVTEIVEALKNVKGIRLMLFISNPPQSFHDMDFIGGMENMKYIVSGKKLWCGLPNIYNSLDVLLRCDSDPGYSFPTLEAAACGVPVITTNQGIDHFITQAGGGILIDADEKDSNGNGRNWYQNNLKETGQRIKKAVIHMRDYPAERLAMGIDARNEILNNWTWEKHINNWRKFFREGIKNANSNSR